eukprot:8788013-Karenia_brevis.AAC.1
MLGAKRQVLSTSRPNHDEEGLGDSSSNEEPEDATDSEQNTLEPWPEWMKRVTHMAEDAMDKCGVEDWVTAQKRKKWKWAGHVARRTDQRWNRRFLNFAPASGHRKPGHPKKRWSDSIDHVLHARGHCKGDWIQVALDREDWAALEAVYCSHPLSA